MSLLPKQAPDHRQRGPEVAQRVADPGLVHRGPSAPHPVDGDQTLFSAAVPVELRRAVVAITSGHNVHPRAARGEPAGERLGRDAGAATKGRILVVEQQDAHR
jgi:hypothetical protein